MTIKVALVHTTSLHQHSGLLLLVCPVANLALRTTAAMDFREFSPEELAAVGATEQFLEQWEGIVTKLEELVEAK